MLKKKAYNSVGHSFSLSLQAVYSLLPYAKRKRHRVQRERLGWRSGSRVLP